MSAALLTGTPLAGRVAVVSGASSGMGAVTAERLAELIHDIDVLQSADIAETVAFMAAVPRHVNLTEITILPTAQAV
ncbi:hypothetical protein [Streptomyces sp. NPDC058457]|uniref:hypothetical protein n=1 Tax=Streptomyces sp. NPDC058457 TaxID=3346507 RepID=UPI003646C183